MIDLTCSFLVVTRGKPSARSKRIWWPNTDSVPVPVRSRFSTPLARIRSISSRYWRMLRAPSDSLSGPPTLRERGALDDPGQAEQRREAEREERRDPGPIAQRKTCRRDQQRGDAVVGGARHDQRARRDQA